MGCYFKWNSQSGLTEKRREAGIDSVGPWVIVSTLAFTERKGKPLQGLERR